MKKGQWDDNVLSSNGGFALSEYISLNKVCKRYQMGQVTIMLAIEVTFDVKKGEFAVVVGASGAGKRLFLIF